MKRFIKRFSHYLNDHINWYVWKLNIIQVNQSIIGTTSFRISRNGDFSREYIQCIRLLHFIDEYEDTEDEDTEDEDTEDEDTEDEDTEDEDTEDEDTEDEDTEDEDTENENDSENIEDSAFWSNFFAKKFFYKKLNSRNFSFRM